MSAAYIDTSVLVAIAFRDHPAPSIDLRLERFSRLLSSNLLDAELRSAFAREGCGFDASLVADIEWVLPDRPLSPEITAALNAGYVKGADLWHIATALYVSGDPAEISFVTLDRRQRQVAEALGFRV